MIQAKSIPVVKELIRTIPGSRGVAIDEDKGVYYVVDPDIIFYVRALSDDSLVYSVDLSAYTEKYFTDIRFSKKYDKIFLGRQGAFGGVVVVLDRNDYSLIDDLAVGSRASLVALVDELDYIVIGTQVSYCQRYSISGLTLLSGPNLSTYRVGNRGGIYDEKYGYIYAHGTEQIKIFKKDYYETGALPIREFDLTENASYAMVVTRDHVLFMADKTLAFDRKKATYSGAAFNDEGVFTYAAYRESTNTVFEASEERAFGKAIVGKMIM